MALDPTIALQTQPPSFDTALKPISSMLNIAGGALDLKRAQATYDADVAQQQALSKSAQIKAQLDQANLQPLIEEQAANTAHAKTQAAAAQFKLTGEQLEKASQIGSGLLSDPDISSGDATKIIPKLTAAKQRMIEAGIPEQTAEVQAAHLIAIAAQHPDAVPQILKNSILQSMPAVQQASAIAPSGAVINNGQEQVLVNTNPLAGPVGPVKSTTVKNQLPPNTPVYNPKTQAKEYLGSQDDPSQGGFDPSHFTPEQRTYMKKTDPVAYANGLESFIKRGQPAGGNSLQIDAPMGQADQVAGTVDQVNKHWLTVSNDANNAKTLEGIAQNIRAYSHGAATGQLAGQKALVQGVLAQLRIGSTGDMKTDTDLMLKNIAMFTGNSHEATDAARVIRQAASPGQKMSEDAINEAALQLVGQARKAIAERDFVKQYKLNNDMNGYANAQAQFSSHADPRIWQYQAMDPAHQRAYMAKLKPDDRAQLIKDVQALEKMGVLK